MEEIDSFKYVILADSSIGFKTPKQLTEINGEPLVKRTIRLLKENGVKDILITSHDKRFDNLGATRYEPLYNDYVPNYQNYKLNKGYWVSAFPYELLDEPICFLMGDVYYSENAIKTIVNSKTDSILFFCTYQNKDERYIKKHDEPLGFKVVDTTFFKYHINKVKEYKDSGEAFREPIAWELYRSINGQPLKEHYMTKNYIAINDESCDIDTLNDIIRLRIKLGGNMIKLQATEDFSLNQKDKYGVFYFDKLQNLKRFDKKEKNQIYKNDEFECDKEIADYLCGNNPLNRTVVKILEIEEPKEKVEPKTEFKKTSKKVKKNKK